MPRGSLSVCPTPGCPHLVPRGGDCPEGHKAQQAAKRDRSRPTARQRGYDRDHERLFRGPVLARDPQCARCGKPSKHADHYPHTRTQLIDMGLNPNDPKYGRGLCASCHSSETVTHDGGFGRAPVPHQPTDPS
jgi:5-methylcytosine-specific restriction protein A